MKFVEVRQHDHACTKLALREAEDRTGDALPIDENESALLA